jgi:hypothetical protein
MKRLLPRLLTLTFALPLTFTVLHNGTAAGIPPLRVERTAAGDLRVFREGGTEPILVQHAQPDFRPFIHPIVAPDGKGVLTENAPGHHLWQHGLYVGLNAVNGLDFWKEDRGFHPRPMARPRVSGHRADWVVVTDWQSATRSPVLTETQHWRLTDRGDLYLLDLEWTLRAEGDITFGKFAYGGLFLRMPFRGRGSAINSEGRSGADAEQKRARWVAVTLPIEGRSDDATIAILDHPRNPDHPQPWRVDGQLGIAPSRCILGDWTLAKGRRTTSRYRVFIAGGHAKPEAIEAAWKDFAR